VEEREQALADELADLDELLHLQNRVAHIRTTKDGSSWARAGGGWRKVSRDEARDGD
jgi:hypothetical protein